MSIPWHNKNNKIIFFTTKHYIDSKTLKHQHHVLSTKKEGDDHQWNMEATINLQNGESRDQLEMTRGTQIRLKKKEKNGRDIWHQIMKGSGDDTNFSTMPWIVNSKKRKKQE